MLRIPEVEEVMELGKELGFNFTRTEAEIVQDRIASSLQELDEFYEMRIEEERLPLRYLTRDPGYRPSAEEDPYNAFIRKCRVEGAEEGILKGKTVALKDHVAVAGIPQSFGSHFMDGYIPDYDATIVTRLLDHGATITGKLNMHDFSSGGMIGVGNFGRTQNPHNPDHVPGGSSSGSGAALAAGLVDISIGGDQGGSVRNPAHYCGVVGLKPTFGLIPHTGVVGADPSLDYLGPMARRVEDVAAALQCLAGPDGYDPRQTEMPEIPNYTELLDRGVKGLKIGILTEGFGYEGMEKDVEEAVLSAVDVLRHAGAEVKKVSIPMHTDAHIAGSAIMLEGTKYLFDTNFGGAFAATYYPTSLITTIGRFKQSHGHEWPLTFKLNMTLAEYLHERYHGRLYAKAQNVRKTVKKAYDKAFAEVDLLVCPTKPNKAPKFVEARNYVEAMEHYLNRGGAAHSRNTMPFNYTGHPAISVPCAKSEGLPIGMQLIAPHFQDLLLLQTAYAFQETVDMSKLQTVLAI
ncbi:amidase family protein [Paenibacillus sp. GP183]|jgi:amidase|uniref:amidase family protein n=1 Tax=Paenibacillus sp. GP183 TaxID=1882751 RepID=UPI00089923E2|nr:amidase family protein [Paenibacillus sp. GP183]SEB72533.1 amidase [Paenibacillus sp. GP183]